MGFSDVMSYGSVLIRIHSHHIFMIIAMTISYISYDTVSILRT